MSAGNFSKHFQNDGRSLISRQVGESAAFDLFVDPIGDTLVPSTRTKVRAHLFVPAVVLPAVKPLRNPSSLGQGQLLNGGLNFLHGAHALIITAPALIFKCALIHKVPKLNG